jgi:DNA-binding XRE family transcriptional regulator
MALGKQIRHYREKAGLRLEDLEQASGVDAGTINALENRDSVRSKYTGKIASAFGLTVEQLEDDQADYPLQLRQTQADSRGALCLVTADNNINGALVSQAWPFPDVPLDKLLRLSERELGRIEGMMISVIQNAENAALKKSGNG